MGSLWHSLKLSSATISCGVFYPPRQNHSFGLLYVKINTQRHKLRNTRATYISVGNTMTYNPFLPRPPPPYLLSTLLGKTKMFKVKKKLLKSSSWWYLRIYHKKKKIFFFPFIHCLIHPFTISLRSLSQIWVS